MDSGQEARQLIPMRRKGSRSYPFQNPMCIRLLFRWLLVRFAGALGLHALDPFIVMLARPIEIHLATSHGIDRTFHAKRADVDMEENRRDHEQGQDTVPCQRQLRFIER